MARALGLVASLLCTAAVGGVGAWWWTHRAPPEPPRSPTPPPLPAPPPRAALPAIRSAPDPPGAEETFDAYAGRPEDQLDVATAALLLAREDDPAVDAAAVLTAFDRWCGDVAEVCRAAEERSTFVDRFCQAAFGAGGLSFDADDPEGRHPDGWQFDRVFERRIGVCLGLALVIQAAADRCGVPSTAVALPNHVFLRMEAAMGQWRNVEVTAQGALRTDADYRRQYQIPELGNGTFYLTPCGRRGLLALLCVNVAAWHLDQHRPAPALRNAERALTLFPDLPAANANRATALLLLERYPQAVLAADAALQIHPELTTALVVRGAARLALGEAGPASRDFARALEVSPLDVDARLGLARARLALAQWREAAADFRAVLEARPDSVVARWGLAEALWKARDVAGAAPVVERLAEQQPNDPAVAQLGGQVYLALGDEPAAERHWRRYLALGGDDPEIRAWIAARR